eukprot:Phypoly_transcript_09095.p1 GENE.Phypoly_transcript_09095~~Phypoly_transcript_09095.p1  ORF type:complete len:404 (+),score=26.74 Phypoly_transcript_09095:218-1429(+)
MRGHEESLPILDKYDVLSYKQQKSLIIREAKIVCLMIVVIITGSLNRVISRITTEPMGNYAFFLSLFNDFAYVIAYGSLLALRYAFGTVSKDSLLFPFRKIPEDYNFEPPLCKGLIRTWWDNMWALKYFVFIGFLEGLANIMSMIANAHVTGILGSLATQIIIIFAMPSAIIILRTKYTIKQVLAAAIVLAGSLVAIIPDAIHKGDVKFRYIILMAASGLPSAISFTIKEYIFRKKKDLELFVVNTTGSLFQMCWWPALMFVAVALQQTDGHPIGQFLHESFMCFSGRTPADAITKCTHMPYPYVAYIVNNVFFNVALLILLKRASALQAFMAINTVLPVGFFLFLYPWPIIGSEKINIEDIISLVVILIGIVIYRWALIIAQRNVVEIKSGKIKTYPVSVNE